MADDRVDEAKGLCADTVEALGGVLEPLRSTDFGRVPLSDQAKVALAALARAYDSLEAIRLLTEAGYSVQAGCHVRSLFELFVSLSHIKGGDSEYLARRYMAFDYVLRERFVGFLKELARSGSSGAERTLAKNPDVVAEAERESTCFREKYTRQGGPRGTQHWSGLTVEQLCRDLDILAEYVAVYRYFSDTIHVSTGSLARQFNVLDRWNGRRIALQRGATSAVTMIVLCYGCRYAARIAELCAPPLGIGDRPLEGLRALSNRHTELFASILEDLN